MEHSELLVPGARVITGLREKTKDKSHFHFFDVGVSYLGNKLLGETFDAEKIRMSSDTERERKRDKKCVCVCVCVCV